MALRSVVVERNLRTGQALRSGHRHAVELYLRDTPGRAGRVLDLFRDGEADFRSVLVSPVITVAPARVTDLPGMGA